MLFARKQALFENRFDAGRQLAAMMGDYHGQQAIILAIPNGGVPIGLEVAIATDSDFDIVISRKIPLPLKPEAGFGAIADDGTAILNDELISQFKLDSHQINYQINQVRVEIRRRTNLYRGTRPPTIISGKTVIVTDDGLASGYTMKAAVEALRKRNPKEIIVAVPAASQPAYDMVTNIADKVITCAIGTMPKFFIADFYNIWYDFSDRDVTQCLREWKLRRFDAQIEPPSVA
ncbi:phosphoribosyltransferase [Chloroflexota bacterium]